MSEPGTDPDGLATARQLGESYAALVGGTEWHVDEVAERIGQFEPAGTGEARRGEHAVVTHRVTG